MYVENIFIAEVTIKKNNQKAFATILLPF